MGANDSERYEYGNRNESIKEDVNAGYNSSYKTSFIWWIDM